MAITNDQLKWRYSVTSGSAGGSLAQSVPALSVGPYCATTELDPAANRLFGPLSSVASSGVQTDHRLIFFHNTSTADTLTGCRLYLAGETAGGAEVLVGKDPAGVTAYTAASGQATSVASGGASAPGGVSFPWPPPRSSQAGIALDDLPPNSVQGVWVKRSLAAGTPALDTDGCVVRVDGDTAL